MEGTTSVTKQTKVKNSANIILLIWCIAHCMLYLINVGLNYLRQYLVGECHQYGTDPSDMPLYPFAIAAIVVSLIFWIINALISLAVPFAIKNNTGFRVIAFIAMGLMALIEIIISCHATYSNIQWLNYSY